MLQGLKEVFRILVAYIAAAFIVTAIAMIAALLFGGYAGLLL